MKYYLLNQSTIRKQKEIMPSSLARRQRRMKEVQQKVQSEAQKGANVGILPIGNHLTLMDDHIFDPTTGKLIQSSPESENSTSQKIEPPKSDGSPEGDWPNVEGIHYELGVATCMMELSKLCMFAFVVIRMDSSDVCDVIYQRVGRRVPVFKVGLGDTYIICFQKQS